MTGSNSEEVLLAPDCYATGKNLIIKRIRLSENWLGYLNRTVKCERSDCIERRTINGSKSFGQISASADVDGSNKHFQNTVVQLKLTRRIVPSA
jgi:hypothetical protein